MSTMSLVSKGISAIIALAFLGVYAVSVVEIRFGEPTYIMLSSIADAIFKEFVLAFEVLAILLFAALIGAVYIARKNGGDA
ncbi:hypothetical protein B6V01_002210 [Methanosarcinales archaeon ex4572_44]|nr:MAG: hypothetical protein B6U67_01725 [Methanosarcinales archaeon ex4484_138]PHP45816.1 MAG: hypothetical protein B6V01_002210 [Methanosarcinales archaeon ex4572_44]RLG24483.1 MAG: hypothetical protein DRN85_07585 [Methanosarcinales archaeon]HHI30880.1 NADH-quinone oxidoreductase subunit J [Candidatus Methanoperedenaceae archaeon]